MERVGNAEDNSELYACIKEDHRGPVRARTSDSHCEYSAGLHAVGANIQPLRCLPWRAILLVGASACA